MIQVIFTSGYTLYCIVLNPFTAQAWNTVSQAWETPNSANWANYVIGLTEYTGTGIYVANFPSAITSPAPYGTVAYQLLGASLSNALPTDTIVGQDRVDWNGAQETTALDLAMVVPMTGNTGNSLADCFNAARAQGFGKWVKNGKTFSLYGPDGATVVHSFTLDQSIAPNQRS